MNDPRNQKKTFKCTGHCGREFTYGDWECFPGQPHVVESKTYYLADAPHVDVKNDPDGLALRSSRTTLHCVPEIPVTDPQTNIIQKIAHPGLKFVMGKYETTDPKEQFFAERSGHLVSYERWFEAYHTPKMKANIKEGKLLERERNIAEKEQEAERKIQEANDLLASVKAGKQRDAVRVGA